MEKSSAIGNSYAVLMYVAFYYQKCLFQFAHYSGEFNLTLHLPWDRFCSDREREKLERVIVCGADVDIIHLVEHEVDVLTIRWQFDEHEGEK